MEIVGTKGSITLGTFALAGIIAGLNTLKAENMKKTTDYADYTDFFLRNL